ncbi:MAG: SDR family NAD(P)-dependent oxidoreductase [Planctomycetota bacterium]|jgi:NAD(P)-dependent dehydrogenase (short-subunit alcohol dehydrogenase family)
MKARLDEKVAIVTGASRGIGSAISIALAAEGAKVVLAARAVEKLQQTADRIKNLGSTSQIVTTELTDEDSIKALVEKTNEKFGRLDILVNCAGITHSAKLQETATADWDRCMQINARAPFILCRQALPLLKQASAGYIINIASVVGVKGYPSQSAYTASKHALRGMTISLSQELRETNIRVHLLCPGGVDTDMVQQVRPDIAKQDLMKPEEIAELVIYLVTHKGNAIVDELHIRRAASSPWF